MPSLRRNIPPSSSLIAFEAAARLLSFTRAAAELCVTQAAISRQIRELEQFLEAPLFVRGYRSVELTAAGSLFMSGISGHLDAIASVTESIRGMRSPETVVVAMTSAFGTYWLGPRLAEFRKAYPNIDLRLAVADEIVDIVKERIDVAIRYGDGGWPRLNSRFLLGSEVLPLCHQSYWEGRARPSSAADLVREVLLCLEGPPVFGNSWGEWFAHYGVHSSGGKHRITVNNFNLLVQAALSGQGIALAGYPLVDHLVESGILAPALDIEPFRVRGGYFIVEPQGQVRKKTCDQFCQWLMDRVRRDAEAGHAERLLEQQPA